MDFQDPTPDFQHQNSPKLQIFWGFNYISSSLYTQLIVVVSPLATIVYFILRAMILYLFQQILKISTSSSNSMTLPRKAMPNLLGQVSSFFNLTSSPAALTSPLPTFKLVQQPNNIFYSVFHFPLVSSYFYHRNIPKLSILNDAKTSLSPIIFTAHSNYCCWLLFCFINLAA